MTKLEEKLIELGYERKENEVQNCWIRESRRITNTMLYFIINNINLIAESGIYPLVKIKREHEIDNMKKAFNEMKEDLEILKGVENEN